MKRILTQGLIMLSLSLPYYVSAQDNYLSTEVQQVIKSANDYLANNQLPEATAMFTQAVRMAPNNVSLRRDLAYTYFLQKNYSKAKEIISPVVNSDAADEQTFQIASAIENAEGYTNKAKRIINQGLDKYPQSGILYNAKGNLLVSADSKNGNKDALAAWNKGIEVEPNYPINYYNAAKTYLNNGRPVWAIVYAETFINLESQSQKSIEMRKLLMNAYKKLFTITENLEIPEFTGNKKGNNNAQSFETAFAAVAQKQAAAIADGFTTENLAKLRTRFVISWMSQHQDNFPSSLINFQDKIIKAGYFPVYNQWLFGAVESTEANNAWIRAHQKAYTNFEMWLKNNPLKPVVTDPKP